MPRPQKCRRIAQSPRVTYFKPQGTPLLDLSEIYLPVDAYEAVRLADYEGLGMEDAAQRMGVSRHTFGRILADGRRALAEAIVTGQALRIEGGNYVLAGKPAQAVGSAKPYSTNAKETFVSKIAITSEGPTLNDKVDPRFGRAGGFVVVDLDTMETQYVDNGQSQAMAHGAGIQAAERVAEAGARVVLTGFVGPKAFQALQAAGVKVGQDLDGLTVGEAVERYKAGQVNFADSPNK